MLTNHCLTHDPLPQVTLEDALIKLDYATQNRRDTGQPWFLGVGFQKPHLDWRIPKGWLDLYPKAAEIKVAKHPTAQPLRYGSTVEYISQGLVYTPSYYTTTGPVDTSK